MSMRSFIEIDMWIDQENKAKEERLENACQARNAAASPNAASPAL